MWGTPCSSRTTSTGAERPAAVSVVESGTFSTGFAALPPSTAPPPSAAIVPPSRCGAGLLLQAATKSAIERRRGVLRIVRLVFGDRPTISPAAARRNRKRKTKRRRRRAAPLHGSYEAVSADR